MPEYEERKWGDKDGLVKKVAEQQEERVRSKWGRESKTKGRKKAHKRFETVKRSVHGQSQTSICAKKEGLVAGKHQSYVNGHFSSA